ncbi:tetratricopeptide repeat protein [Thermophagus sp. OGC60D27]|uniref:tetratricopeptide repeat protein n=1 Tax=Thermophagus sp. OGC60D27 TaxID=3458415 RepID=UPI0040379B52
MKRFLRLVVLLFLIIFFTFGNYIFPLNGDIDLVPALELENRIRRLIPDSLEKADSLVVLFIRQVNGLGNDTLASSGWYLRGEVAYYKGQFDFSGDCYQKSIDLLGCVSAYRKRAVYYNNLGLTRYFKERYNEALEAFIKSSEYEKKLDNEYGFAQCLHNIALVQEKAGRLKRAEQYFDHSLSLFIKMDSLADAAAVLNDFAIYLSGREQNKLAIEKYREAVKIYETLNQTENIAKVKCNIGSLLLAEKRYSDAARYLDEALDYFKDRPASSFLINIYSLFGDLYFQQERVALAVIFYERAEKLAKDIGWNDLRQKNLYSLYKALKIEKEYEKALKALELYTGFKDSLIISNNAFLKEDIDRDLETELLKKELSLMKEKNNHMKLILIILCFIILIGGVGHCCKLKWLKG